MPYNVESLKNLKNFQDQDLLKINNKLYPWPEVIPDEVVNDIHFWATDKEGRKKLLEEFYSKEENKEHIVFLKKQEEKKNEEIDNNLSSLRSLSSLSSRPESFEDFVAFLKKKYKQIQELEVSQEKEPIRAKLLERLGKQIFYTQASLDEKDGLINTFLKEKEKLEKKLEKEKKKEIIKKLTTRLEDLM